MTITRYNEVKDAHPGIIIMVRVGDFYESYHEDAETVAQVCEITLTGRSGENGRIPMAGCPYHSIEKYLAKLLCAGLKTALCDEL